MSDLARPPAPASWPLLAASCAVFVLAWIVGLVIGGPAATPASPGAEVLDLHRTAGLVQPVLVHGLAGLALAGMSVGLMRILRPALPLLLLGVTAALLSFTQLFCEFVLALEPHLTADDAQAWWTALTLFDGVKMLVLAALMAMSTIRMQALEIAGRVLPVVGYLGAVAIAISGVGYFLVSETLMIAANVSLPLLLLWAIVLPIVLRVPRHPAADRVRTSR